MLPRFDQVSNRHRLRCYGCDDVPLLWPQPLFALSTTTTVTALDAYTALAATGTTSTAAITSLTTAAALATFSAPSPSNSTITFIK